MLRRLQQVVTLEILDDGILLKIVFCKSTMLVRVREKQCRDCLRVSRCSRVKTPRNEEI
jgi:hypothetical protein